MINSHTVLNIQYFYRVVTVFLTKIRLDYLNLVFVRLPQFLKPLEECESLQDKLLYSLCHAHEYNDQPDGLKGNVFDRLFTLIKICNFSAMEQDEYIRRAMFRADQREQLRYARDKGMEEIFALWESGVPLDEAKKKLGSSRPRA